MLPVIFIIVLAALVAILRLRNNAQISLRKWPFGLTPESPALFFAQVAVGVGLVVGCCLTRHVAFAVFAGVIWGFCLMQSRFLLRRFPRLGVIRSWRGIR